MEELKKEKEEYKTLHEQSLENEKILKKNHEKIVTLDEKARDIKFKIQQKKAQDAQEKSQASKKQGGKSLSHRGAKKRIEDQLSSFSKIEVRYYLQLQCNKSFVVSQTIDQWKNFGRA